MKRKTHLFSAVAFMSLVTATLSGHHGEVLAGFSYPYPPSDILHFNPAKNSGWFYLAQTIPYNGKAFWFAAVRSFSTSPSDASAHLLYGITDVTNWTYAHGVIPGRLTERSTTTDLSFVDSNGQVIFRFRETQPPIGLPVVGQRYYRLTGFGIDQTLSFREPFLYESGDGVIPMAPKLDSLYVSLAPLGGRYWVDFQKFNLGAVVGLGAPTPLFLLRGGLSASGPNHRWGSVILSTAVGSLPRGTAIVYWDIFDTNGNRQPGEYTDIDVLAPGSTVKTAGEFTVTELAHWDSGHKKYLQKWRLTNAALGVDLVLQTIIPNQEFTIPGPTPFYFYEGTVYVYHPTTGQVVGSGMWEQTHNEWQN